MVGLPDWVKVGARVQITNVGRYAGVSVVVGLDLRTVAVQAEKGGPVTTWLHGNFLTIWEPYVPVRTRFERVLA